MKALTARQTQLIQFLREFVELNGYPPSLRELMDGIGVRSLAGVTCHLDNLVRKGYLRRNSGGPRAIALLRDEHGVPLTLSYSASDDHA